MSDIDRALCRRAAAECIELARITTHPETKQTLLTRGQEWPKLAYSEHDAEFERLLGEFNTEQMGAESAAAAAGAAGAAAAKAGDAGRQLGRQAPKVTSF